ncbi:hypothetical protein VKT23_006258 [Stygiomarasmius scandens]|uniref:F-box domain-containing protein n=1 Tax=Marasmiellus scandens TaxID=2682957 RepID=A0ABR1JRY3_9AGAR
MSIESDEPQSNGSGSLCRNCQVDLKQVGTETFSLPEHIPLDSFLTSNLPPSHGDSTSMRNSLADAQRQLESIEHQLQLLQERRLYLERTKEKLSQYIIEQKVVLHPIRSFPAEMLAKIFKFAVEDASASWYNDTHQLWHNDSLSIKGVRWVIGYVCRRWRDLSLNTPRLWTSIQLHLNHIGRGRAISLLLGVSLQRSQQLPLNIGLYALRNDRELETNSLLMTLLPFASRWHRLYLRMDLKDIEKCFRCVEPFLSVTLEALEIRGFVEDNNDGDGPLQAQVSVCNVFQNAKALRTVVLHWLDLGTIKFPLSSITSLEVVSENIPLLDLQSHLYHTKNLESLIVRGDLFSWRTADRSTDVASVSLPRIRLLVFGPCNEKDHQDRSQAACTRFLESITVPSLLMFGYHTSSDFSSILSLFERSKCSPGFIITDVPVSDKEIQKLILHKHASANLCHLSLSNITDMSTDSVKLLSYCSNQTPECNLPRLYDLSLSGHLCFDTGVFVEMVKSRLNLGALAFRKIALHWRGDSLPSDLDVFECFKDPSFKGLQFSFDFE